MDGRVIVFLTLLIVLIHTKEGLVDPALYVYPEHTHISFGDEPLQMVVTWTTLNYTSSTVQYGVSSLSLSQDGLTSIFHDNNDTERTWYIHKVVLADLKPGVRYYYHCGSQYGWSDLFWFTARRPDLDWAPWIAVYGDMGNENAQSLPRLQQEVMNKTIDLVLHIGDLAYDLDFDDGRVGDAFMRQIEPIAAYIPYMVSPGNHEYANNFTHYKRRFNMPGESEGIFYSYNIGRAHIISISTEVYYFHQWGKERMITQLNWLKQDLMNANKPENRQRHPWLIVVGHRPMYCAVKDMSDCNYVTNRVRLALEQLLYEQGVDVAFWAHEHEYMRMYPMYNYTVCNGSKQQPYKNPRAPVHVVTGSAGCNERHDSFKPKPPFIAANITDYGYTKLKVINSTHLYWEQVSDDKHGKVVDRVMIESDRHGAGLFTCHQDTNWPAKWF